MDLYNILNVIFFFTVIIAVASVMFRINIIDNYIEKNIQIEKFWNTVEGIVLIIVILVLLGIGVVEIIYEHNKIIDHSITTTKQIKRLYEQDDIVYLLDSDGNQYRLSEYSEVTDESFKLRLNNDKYSNVFIEKKDETYKWKKFFSEEETIIHIAYVDRKTYNNIMNIHEYNINVE